MKVKEMNEKIYEEFKKQIDLISEVSAKETEAGPYKADIGVATDMFINYVKTHEESVFVDIAAAKSRIAELETQLSE